MKYTATVLRGETLPASLAAGLLKDVAALRPEIVSLRTESIRGAARSSAARSAMVDLVTALSLARVCGVVQGSHAGVGFHRPRRAPIESAGNMPMLARRWSSFEKIPRSRAASMPCGIGCIRPPAIVLLRDPGQRVMIASQRPRAPHEFELARGPNRAITISLLMSMLTQAYRPLKNSGVRSEFARLPEKDRPATF